MANPSHPQHPPLPSHCYPGPFIINPWVTYISLDMCPPANQSIHGRELPSNSATSIKSLVRYVALENAIKDIQDTILRLGVHDNMPFESYLEGFDDVPLSFILPKFQKKFDGKGDSSLHSTSYKLMIPTIRDLPTVLKLYSPTVA
ncbi:hypothetical protein AMTR_s00073p00080770 [Amborella trichopoda]|uniref:Uncharacterized protein n=1 Tax=Amborella trichopoda TaxID=13333 RepID=W1NNH2_AMBTC|nr:hypothetical protein AMTR_s00073p00080770 [Amborella trichopoda]